MLVDHIGSGHSRHEFLAFSDKESLYESEVLLLGKWEMLRSWRVCLYNWPFEHQQSAFGSQLVLSSLSKTVTGFCLLSTEWVSPCDHVCHAPSCSCRKHSHRTPRTAMLPISRKTFMCGKMFDPRGCSRRSFFHPMLEQSHSPPCLSHWKSSLSNSHCVRMRPHHCQLPALFA